MKDYFEALAARTIQPERGVQPRPRAPFEDAGVLPPGARDGSSAPPSAAQSRSRAASPAGVDERHDNPDTPARRLATAGGDPREPDASAQVDPRTGVRQSLLPAGDAGREQSSDERHTARTHKTVSIESSSGPAADRPASSSERTVRGTEAVAPGSIAPRTIAPRATQAAAKPSPRVASASDDAATVRIHIGRVDVRAIMPASAPQAPARGTRRGIITIDEYVQQRGGAKS